MIIKEFGIKPFVIYYEKIMTAKLGSGIKRSPLWVLFFGLNLIAGGQMIFWVNGFRFGFYNTLGAYLILFSAYLCLTFCLAEISSCLPFSGGSYALARVTGGPFIGFVVGCADRIDLLANISLNMMIASWIVTHAIGIPQTYSQILCWLIIYSLSCFNLWKPSSERFWWPMAACLMSYIIVFLIFLVGCSMTAEFGNGLATTSTVAITELDFLSLFPKCMLFFSGLQFIQISAVDVVNPKQNIPRLLIAVVIIAFIAGIILLYLVASHSPINIFYSEEFPLSIVPALSSVLTNSSPRLIALLLLPTFFAAFQGNLFALHRVSMAMLQSNLLMVIRPSTWNFITDDQFELIRVGAFIICGMVVGFIVLREEWFWVVAQVAMLGTMTSQCANLISFIVFRVQFGSLDRGFVSSLGITGALYPLMVFILVVIGIVARGRDGRIAMCLYLFVLLMSGIVYYWGLQSQQKFSAEEEAALFVAHVIRHNAQRSRRRKLRASRAASLTRSHSSIILLAGAALSFRGTRNSGDSHTPHDSPSFLARKRRKSGADDESSYSSHGMPVSGASSNAPVSDCKEDSLSHGSGATEICSDATPTVQPSSNDNSSDTAGRTVAIARDGIASLSLSTSPDVSTSTDTATRSTKVAIQRTMSRWQVPKKALTLALRDEEGLLDGSSTAKSPPTVEFSLPGKSESSPKGAATAAGVPSAFHVAANAFSNQGDTVSNKNRRLDRRKEAVIRAFKQSSDIHRKLSSSGPVVKVKPGGANLFRAAVATAQLQQQHKKESGAIVPSAADVENQQAQVHGPKLTSTAAHVMAAKHWAKLTPLNILTHPFRAFQQSDDEDFDEEDQTYTERRSNQAALQLSGKDRPLPAIAGNSCSNNGAPLQHNTDSTNNSGSGGNTPNAGGGEELAIADIKPTDLIDRYYTEDQFNYHAFLDDVFGGTKNTQGANGSNPVNKSKKIVPFTSAVQAAVAASRFQTVTNGPNQGSQSANNSNNNNNKIDAQFVGRKLHRILPPIQSGASRSTMTLDTQVAVGGGTAGAQVPPSLEAENAGVVEKELAVVIPLTPSLHHLEHYLRIETPVSAHSVQGQAHFEGNVLVGPINEEKNRFSPRDNAHS
jgi:amino acid permease